MNYDYIKDRFGILKCFLFSALMPDHRFHYAANLDWNPRFLEPEERARVNKKNEYQGSDIPIGQNPRILVGDPPVTKKEWKRSLTRSKI